MCKRAVSGSAISLLSKSTAERTLLDTRVVESRTAFTASCCFHGALAQCHFHIDSRYKIRQSFVTTPVISCIHKAKKCFVFIAAATTRRLPLQELQRQCSFLIDQLSSIMSCLLPRIVELGLTLTLTFLVIAGSGQHRHHRTTTAAARYQSANRSNFRLSHCFLRRRLIRPRRSWNAK